MDVTQISLIHHIVIVLVLLWMFSSFLNFRHPLLYLASFLYLHKVNAFYVSKLRDQVRSDERKQANQKRLLCDSESVRWLNHTVKKMWPICMEEVSSQKFLLPVVPWFLGKYKPWTAEEATMEHLYLGRDPPMITEMRVLGHCSDDDHLVMELGMNFLSADDTSGVLVVKLRKILGFGISAKLNITGMHLEGKVLVGVKFLRGWPFIGRLRVCFVESPYFAMTVKPIFKVGIDVTVIPGIAGWMDKLLTSALQNALVEPNMLVVNVEKFASEPTVPENWFSMDERDPIAYAELEIIEASSLKSADLNGFSDPYVKGHLGSYTFRTKIQKKTLSPKWHDEFKIPIYTWDSPNTLTLEVCDKDYYFDDILGDCSIDISNLQGGRRHVMWLPLQNVKMGRLHLALTVKDANEKGREYMSGELSVKTGDSSSSSSEAVPSLENLITNEDFILQSTVIGESHINDSGQGKATRSGSATYRDSNSLPKDTGINQSLQTSHLQTPRGDILRPSGTFRRNIKKIRSIFFFRGSKAEDSTGLERGSGLNKPRQE